MAAAASRHSSSRYRGSDQLYRLRQPAGDSDGKHDGRQSQCADREDHPHAVDGFRNRALVTISTTDQAQSTTPTTSTATAAPRSTAGGPPTLNAAG